MDRTLPTKQQLDFMDWEFGFFFHYGIRTFYEGRTDWDGVPMDPAGFAPSAQDCRQWIETAKAAGAAYAVMTAKHHDGFAMWNTETTACGVKESPYLGGRGDVVREFTDACRAYGLKTGLYYSPAQFGSAETKPADYDDYFISQITELLTNYGRIDYLWFDGCGSDGHRFDRARIVKAIRALRPDILLFNMWDPDTRWVGNEEGYAHPADRYVIPPREDDLFTENRFLPYECDCKLHPDSWFYADAAAPRARTLTNLLGLWDLSVGRGGNLLLNVAPDCTGRLPENDVKLLRAFGEANGKRFSSPFVKETDLCGTQFEPALPEDADVSCVVLTEDLTGGEYGGSYRLEYVSGGDKTLLCEGEGIGHKRILRFPPVQVCRHGQIRLTTTKEIRLRAFEIYR